MAVIGSFEELPHSAGRRHPTVVTCGWRITTVEADTLLTLDTYGSDTRKLVGKASQSIQLDRRGAEQLKQLLQRAFPGI